MTHPRSPADEPTRALPRGVPGSTLPSEGGEATEVAERPRAYVPAPTGGGFGGDDWDGGRDGGGGEGNGNGGGRDRIDRALIIAGLVVLAVIIGVGAYLIGRSSGNGPSGGTTTTGPQTSITATTVSSTSPSTTASTSTTRRTTTTAVTTTQPPTTATTTSNAPPTSMKVPPTAPTSGSGPSTVP